MNPVEIGQPTTPARIYAPNGITYQNGVAVGFHDGADSLGILSEEEAAAIRKLIASDRGATLVGRLFENSEIPPVT